MADADARDTVERLIGQVAMGDRDAFAELYDLTSGKLLAVAMRILKDREQAEDVLQESYVKIWRKADTYRSGTASPMSWLICVTRNTAIDRYRQDRPLSFADEDVFDLVDNSATPEENAVQSSRNARLAHCLNQIEDRKASIIRAAFYSGRTYKELSAATKTPVNTIKTWVRRSLIVLRACLESKSAPGSKS